MSKIHDFYGRYLFTRILGLAKYCFEQSLPPSLLKRVDWSTLTEATQTALKCFIFKVFTQFFFQKNCRGCWGRNP